MQSDSTCCAGSKKARWAGWIIGGLPALFLLADAGMKIAQLKPVMEATGKLGFSTAVVLPLGITLLICTLLYLIPRTAGLGAILLTGYLGGAVATNVHHGDPLFSHILFPVYFGVLLWVGLVLREPRMRGVLPCCVACKKT